MVNGDSHLAAGLVIYGHIINYPQISVAQNIIAYCYGWGIQQHLPRFCTLGSSRGWIVSFPLPPDSYVEVLIPRTSACLSVRRYCLKEILLSWNEAFWMILHPIQLCCCGWREYEHGHKSSVHKGDVTQRYTEDMANCKRQEKGPKPTMLIPWPWNSDNPPCDVSNFGDIILVVLQN